MIYLFDAELWLWDARQSDSWTFLSLPEDASDEIRQLVDGVVRGFGSVRVSVTIGGTSWRTSIFPDSKTGTYWLPIKKAVRTSEGIGAGDTVTVRLELVDL